MNRDAARCTSQSFENAQVLRAFRPHRFRSVPLCRSTKRVFTARLTADARRARATARHVPSTTRVLIRTTQFPDRFREPLWPPELMIGYIGEATSTGLAVTDELDEYTYKKGQQVTREELVEFI